MTRDDEFDVRLGRIRSRRTQRARPFIAQALAATEKASLRMNDLQPGQACPAVSLWLEEA
jgi:hypothetical protein